MGVCTNRRAHCFQLLLILGTLSGISLGSITKTDVVDKTKDSEETTLNSKDFENAPEKDVDLKMIGINVPEDPTMGSKAEGDILMPKTKEKKFLDERTGLGRNAIRQSYRKWPNNEIPYTLSTQYGTYSRSVIAKAMNEYHTKTCVRFVPRDTKKHRDYVYIHPDDGCYSLVGRVGGRQPLSLDSGCIQTGTIVHELMHTVGFFHEQSRYDRDHYIEIVWPNVINGADDQFEKYGTNVIDQFNEPYDYSSIMHYGPYAFSANGKRTILARRPGSQKMGQRVQFSEVDLRKINRLYQCDAQTMIKKPPRPQLPIQEPTITPDPPLSTTSSPITTSLPKEKKENALKPTKIKSKPEEKASPEKPMPPTGSDGDNAKPANSTNTHISLSPHETHRQFTLFRVPRHYIKKSVTLSSNRTDGVSRSMAGIRTRAASSAQQQRSQLQRKHQPPPQPPQQPRRHSAQRSQQSHPHPKRSSTSPVASAPTRTGDARSGQCQCLATAISTLKSAIRFARSRARRVRHIARLEPQTASTRAQRAPESTTPPASPRSHSFSVPGSAEPAPTPSFFQNPRFRAMIGPPSSHRRFLRRRRRAAENDRLEVRSSPLKSTPKTGETAESKGIRNKPEINRPTVRIQSPEERQQQTKSPLSPSTGKNRNQSPFKSILARPSRSNASHSQHEPNLNRRAASAPRTSAASTSPSRRSAPTSAKCSCAPSGWTAHGRASSANIEIHEKAVFIP